MIIGLTGGIGSGKSTIAQGLRELGYPVYDTDSEAKRVIVEDQQVRQQMVQLFGENVYQDGVYQTSIVAQKVFHDHQMLQQLNAIVHPALKKDLQAWINRQTSPCCFVECAILYSSGLHTLCDKVIAVTAPEEIRIQRTIARDHTTIDKVRARIKAQDTTADLQKADWVINNDENSEIYTICLQIREKFCTFVG